MRLQAERLPDPMDRRGRMTHRLRHGPQAPVRRTFGPRLQRLSDGGSDLVVTDLTRRARTRLVIQPVHAVTGEPIAPQAGRVSADIQLGRDLLVGQPARRGKHNACPHRHRLRRAMLAGQRCQSLLLGLVQLDRNRPALGHSCPLASGFSSNVAYLSITTLEAGGSMAACRLKCETVSYLTGGSRRSACRPAVRSASPIRGGWTLRFEEKCQGRDSDNPDDADD